MAINTKAILKIKEGTFKTASGVRYEVDWKDNKKNNKNI